MIEVLRNVRVAEYGQDQLGILATNVLLNIADVWILGYQDL